MTRTRDLVVALALVVATLCVFWPVCDNDFFLLDDDDYVVENRHVRAGLTARGLWWALTTFHSANWHPLTWISLQLDQELFGPHPAGFHRTNLIFHAANALLLFLFWRRQTGALWPSAVVAGLFALHPLHVESVAWVAERKDVLSTLFWMLTLLTYGWYVRRPGWGRFLVVLVFALGLMAKPMLVTLPFVLVLLDVWPFGRWRPGSDGGAVPLRRLVGEKVPLLILVAGSCVLTVLAQHRGQMVTSLEELPFSESPRQCAGGVRRLHPQDGLASGPGCLLPASRATPCRPGK